MLKTVLMEIALLLPSLLSSFSGRSQEGNLHYQFPFTISTNFYNTLHAIWSSICFHDYFNFLYTSCTEFTLAHFHCFLLFLHWKINTFPLKLFIFEGEDRFIRYILYFGTGFSVTGLTLHWIHIHFKTEWNWLLNQLMNISMQFSLISLDTNHFSQISLYLKYRRPIWFCQDNEYTSNFITF
jgi:hypothetical protein